MRNEVENNSESRIKSKLGEVFDVSAEGAVSVVGEFLGDTLLGTFLPGVSSAVFSIKQRKVERNIMCMIEEMKKIDDHFNEKLLQMDKYQRDQFQKYTDLVTEYVTEEQQVDKIKYLVNGLLGIAEHEEINEDFVLFYYDTLNNLRLVDISVLNFYYLTYTSFGQSGKTYQDILDENNIDLDQYNAIREKLVRVGLFSTQRDKEIDDLYKNVLTIQDHLTLIDKGKGKKLARFKKISKNDKYSITKFGREFIEFFINDIEKN